MKRHVEIFTAGCQVCHEAVQMVREMACPDCEIQVHDLHKGWSDLAVEYGVKTVPAVAVNGKLVSCCDNAGPSASELSAAGVGRRLS